MVTKVEVGKFYIYRDFTGKGCARECLYVNEDGFLLGTNEKGISTYFFGLTDAKLLVEYKQPVVHKRYLCWFKSPNSKRIECNIFATPWIKNSNYILLSETEVTYEEEQV